MPVNTIALQEAKTSTEIENIFTTEDELYKAISDTQKRENINPATKEVLKYREALWAGYNTLQENEKYPLDPLLKMCIAHYQFEAIHPFQDGNGRTGRILNLLYLVSKGLLSQPVLYISKFIIHNKEDYCFKFGAVTQRNSWESRIEFMLETVEKTSLNTNVLINEILDQMDSTLEYAKGKMKWYSKELNEVIFSQPYIKPNVVGKIIGKSSGTTLTKYINELVIYKILRPKKDGVEVFYINDDLLRILEG